MKTRMISIGTVVILFILASAVYGQANIGLMGVGAKVGYLDPEGDENSTFGFGGVADLGTIMPNVGLEAELLYWSKSYDEHGLDFSVSSISVAAIAKYYFKPEGEQLRPFAGGGLGFNRASAKSEFENPLTGHTEKDTHSDTDLAIHIAGGAKYALSPQLDGIGEFRYVMAGDWDYWGIFAGVIYRLNQ